MSLIKRGVEVSLEGATWVAFGFVVLGFTIAAAAWYCGESFAE